VALSPRGDRLTWIFYQGSRRQEGLLAARAIELAVSNTDGNAMRIIGVLGTEPGDQYYRHRRLTWLPDAKHVSFSHRGARWSVPVVP